MAEYFGLSTWQVPFPDWKTMLGQVIIFFFFEDAWHYVGESSGNAARYCLTLVLAHQIFHYGPFYKHIHKIHHKYSAPFGLAAEYAHPLEVLTLGLGTIGGPLLYCYFTQNLHIVTVYIWVTLRLFQAVDSHSGYDFPWSLAHWFPLWGGADHHDFHHMAFVNNYASSFRYLDFLFGTDKKYRAHKEKLRKARDAMKGASKAEIESMTQKFMNDAADEGLRAEKVIEGLGPKFVGGSN